MPTRRSPQRADVLFTALLVVLAATGFRLWALRGTWLFYDDLFLVQQALASSLDASYLVEPYNGHLMPGGRLLIWLNTRSDPWGYTLPVLEMGFFLLLLGLGYLRLLLRLFGARWAVLAPLVLGLLSPILIPASIWWAAAVNQLPMLAATMFATSYVVDHLRDGRRRSLVLSTLWLVLGLLFVERTLLALLVIWPLALCYFTTGTFPERLRQLWTRHRALVLTHGVLVATYLALYLPFAANFNAASITERPLFGVLSAMVGTAYAAGFWGGPLAWHVSDVTQSEADPNQLLLLLGWAVLAGLVVLTVRTRERALRAWLLPAAALLANAGLIAVSRAIYFGPEIALDYRFQSEAALTTALALALAFIPVRDAPESSAPRSGATAPATAPGVAAICVVFVVLATISTARYPLRNLDETSPRRYLETVADSAERQPGSQFLDLTVPPWIWAPLAYPTNTYSHVFAPLTDRMDIREVTTDDTWLVAPDGRFQRVELTPVRHEQHAPSPTTGCVGQVTSTRQAWPLDGPVVGFGWFLEVTYDADAPTTLTVEVAGLGYDIEVGAGSHTLLMPAAGDEYDSVTLSVADTEADVCLRGLRVGTLNDAASATPDQVTSPAGS